MSKRYAYFVFSLLFLLYFFDYASRMVVVSLFPFLKESWGISDAQCGMLVSAVYWAIIVLVFPASILIDRWSRKKSIGLMAVMWSLATGLCALTRNFSQLFIARTAVGIGEAGYAPGGTAMISALFPEEKRSAVMGIWNASIPLGSAAGILLGGLIAESLGWRHAFWMVAVPGMIVSLLFFTVKDYKTVDLVKTKPVEGETKLREKMGFWEIVLEFVRTPSLMLTYFAFAGNTFVTTAMISWLPVYFYRTDNSSMTQASMKGSIVMLAAIIGAPLGGWLTDRWLKRRKNARLLFASSSSMLTAVLLAVAIWFTDGNMQFALLFATGAAAIAFLPAGAAVTQDVIHPGLRAISYACCVVVQNLLGSSLGPIYVGRVSDLTDIRTAMGTLPLFVVAASILFFAASFFYNRDLAKVEKVELSFEE